MQSTCAIPVGVVIARERIGNPWQEYIWRPVSVFTNPPELDGWRELRRSEDRVEYHAATVTIELHRKETEAYRINLESGEPAVYVVLRHDPGADEPVSLPCVTVSPHESQAYLESGLESVHQVPMPQPLVELVREFVEVHHVEQPFVKRQRQKHQVEEHKFGQEPIFVLRRRMRQTNGDGGDD
jgi:hypothetical protein